MFDVRNLSAAYGQSQVLHGIEYAEMKFGDTIPAGTYVEGTVDKVKVISGPPMLVGPAVDAITHWRYEPTYLNGQAVSVILTARISFSLGNNPQ